MTTRDMGGLMEFTYMAGFLGCCLVEGKGRKSLGLAGYCKNAAIILFIWEILLRVKRSPFPFSLCGFWLQV